MLAIIYKLISGIVLNSRKTSITTSVHLNSSVFFFPSYLFFCLGVLIFFSYGKDKKVKKKKIPLVDEWFIEHISNLQYSFISLLTAVNVFSCLFKVTWSPFLDRNGKEIYHKDLGWWKGIGFLLTRNAKDDNQYFFEYIQTKKPSRELVTPVKWSCIKSVLSWHEIVRETQFFSECPFSYFWEGLFRNFGEVVANAIEQHLLKCVL